jgi:type I restriction enzyme R subunit
LYKAILPDPDAGEFVRIRSALIAIKNRIRIIGPQESDDIHEIKNKISSILDRSIQPEVIIKDKGSEVIDIGNVDFEKLKERFLQSKRKNIEISRMKSSIQNKIDKMVEKNRSRMNFKEKYEEMIDRYNNYSVSVEVQFEELFALARELNEEDQRHIKENLSEEELALFDIVVNHEKINLKESDRKKIKNGISQLLETLQSEKLVLDWCKQQKQIAQVKVSIEKELDNVLPTVYDRSLFTRTCDEVFDHVYQNYCKTSVI